MAYLHESKMDKEQFLNNIKVFTGQATPEFMLTWPRWKFEEWLQRMDIRASPLVPDKLTPIEVRAWHDFQIEVTVRGVAGFNRELQLECWFLSIRKEVKEWFEGSLVAFNRMWLEEANTVQEQSKVTSYVMDESKSWEERYKELEAHHIQETTALVEKLRKSRRPE